MAVKICQGFPGLDPAWQPLGPWLQAESFAAAGAAVVAAVAVVVADAAAAVEVAAAAAAAAVVRPDCAYDRRCP